MSNNQCLLVNELILHLPPRLPLDPEGATWLHLDANDQICHKRSNFPVLTGDQRQSDEKSIDDHAGQEPRRSSMARRSKTWTRGAENWGNSPSRLSGGSRLQSFLSSFFGATHLLPVIFIFCELVLWIFFYLKSKRLFTFNGSNLHLIINFTMLIWNFPCNCIHYSVSIVCFVQSAFCCTF